MNWRTPFRRKLLRSRPKRSELAELRARVPELVAEAAAAKMASDEVHKTNICLKAEFGEATKQADDAKENARTHYVRYQSLTTEHQQLKAQHDDL